MTRHIDADVLLLDLTYQKATFESVRGGRSGLFAKGVACGLDGAIQSVKNAEAEDVSPVKHGKWLPLFNGEYTGGAYWFECSECKTVVSGGLQSGNRFCKGCGAKMEDGK